jgi:RimJ/RimL family protein N-acetyltransferase
LNATTERLTLRPARLEDLDDLARVSSDPAVMRFSLYGPIDREKAREKLEEHLELFRTRGWGMHFLHSRDDGRFVGVCGMTLQEVDGIDEPEIGYRLMPEFWGKGLATEAVRAWVDHCFTELDLPRVIAIIEPENVGSIRVAEKSGLSFEKEIWKWERTVRIYTIARPTS